MAALPPYASTGQRVWYYTFRVICGLLFFFLIFPIMVIVPLSFNAQDFFTFTPEMLSFSAEGYSLKHYEDFFSNSDWQRSLRNSFTIAARVPKLTESKVATGAIVNEFRNDLCQSQLLKKSS